MAISLLACSLGCGEKSNRHSSTADAPAEDAPAADTPAIETGRLQPVVLQLNWYPEAEHGGFYAAQVERIFESAGLEVEIRPGGRATPVAAELSLGRAQFAISNAADVLLFREQGVDIVAVMAAMQHNPRCIIVRADSNIDSLQELAGLTLQLGTGRPFVEFLKQSGVLKGVQVVPYFGTVAQLVTTPKMAQQGYVFSEPLLAEAAGTPVQAFMVSELGFDPYASVLVTTGKLASEQPDLVKKMVAASVAGWSRYLTEPAWTNEYIVSQNKQGLTLVPLNQGVEKMRPLVLPVGNSRESLGTMTAERWQTLVEQMTKLGLITSNKIRADECFQTLVPQPLVEQSAL